MLSPEYIPLKVSANRTSRGLYDFWVFAPAVTSWFRVPRFIPQNNNDTFFEVEHNKIMLRYVIDIKKKDD